MTALLSLLVAKATPCIIGGGAILAAFVATYVKGRLSGAKNGRSKPRPKPKPAISKTR
jgi:hypothetical protein